MGGNPNKRNINKTEVMTIVNPLRSLNFRFDDKRQTKSSIWKQ